MDVFELGTISNLGPPTIQQVTSPSNSLDNLFAVLAIVVVVVIQIPPTDRLNKAFHCHKPYLHYLGTLSGKNTEHVRQKYSRPADGELLVCS